MATLRTLLVLLASSLVFASCGGTAEQPLQASAIKTVQDTNYQMEVFHSWDEIAATDLDTSLPASHVRVFQSLQPIKGVYSKLSIIKEDLLSPTASLDYADRNILNTPKVTQNFTKLQSMETTIAGDRTIVHIYEGQSTALSPQLLFLQTFVVRNSTEGYTLTFSISPSVTDTTPYLNLLRSFRFPAAAAQ